MTREAIMTLVLAGAMVGGSGAMAQEVMISQTPGVPDFDLQVRASTHILAQVKGSTNGNQTKDDLFAGAEKFAQNATKVTEIHLDPNTMGMVAGEHGRDAEMAKKMNFMTIYTYQYEKPNMYSQDDFEAYRKKLMDGSWNCPIRTRSKSSTTDICSRAGADHETNEMVILTSEPQKLTFIHMSGKMSLGELDEMGHVPGPMLMPRHFMSVQPNPAPMAPMNPMPPTNP